MEADWSRAEVNVTQRGDVERIALSGAGDLDAAAGAAEAPAGRHVPEGRRPAVRPPANGGAARIGYRTEWWRG
ncbi:hypothetical protein BBK14_24580 [Parafrankia soli]|uniref:Uncharacterized protein n=1 Tax=Parafrankia soli TaxID=2599596 RepID=A0A1S1PN51_9ACTN|nr:hypothetical protein BBK14_24580 [Parafrankia soli]